MGYLLTSTFEFREFNLLKQTQTDGPVGMRFHMLNFLIVAIQSFNS